MNFYRLQIDTSQKNEPKKIIDGFMAYTYADSAAEAEQKVMDRFAGLGIQLIVNKIELVERG